MRPRRKSTYFQKQQRKARRQSGIAAIGCLTTLLLLAGALYWGLTTALDDMTRNDCEVHKIQAACDSLNK